MRLFERRLGIIGICGCVMQQKTIDGQIKYVETTVSNDLITITWELLHISEETPYPNEAVVTLDLLGSSSSSPLPSSSSFSQTSSSTMPHVTLSLGTSLIVIGILFAAMTYSLFFHWLKLKKPYEVDATHNNTTQVSVQRSRATNPTHHQHFPHYREIDPFISIDHHFQVLSSLHQVTNYLWVQLHL